MTFRNDHLSIRIALVALSTLVGSLGLAGLAAAQGYVEINQTVVENAGGFPYVIDAPGSYRLTGNIIKEAGDGTTMAIDIQADGVDLDLNNFFIQGPGTCARNFSTGVVTCTGHIPGSGIQSNGGFRDITIRRGKVSGFFNGISLDSSNALIEQVMSTQNAFLGVSAIGDGTSVQQVSAQRNGTTGIVVQNHSHVANCNASQNDDYGISANLNSSVTQSFVMGNRLGGMQLNPSAVFSQSQVLDNFGVDPVFSGQDAGDNNCTNAVGAPTGC